MAHVDKDFDVINADAQLDRSSVKVIWKDDEWVVTAFCPECTVNTERRYGRKVVAKIATVQEVPDKKKVTMSCDCGKAHKGRDDKNFDVGCGAFWKVSL